METLYEVRFSIYGADAMPAWRRTIASAVAVKATGRTAAIAAAKVKIPTLTDADILGIGVR